MNHKSDQTFRWHCDLIHLIEAEKKSIVKCSRKPMHAFIKHLKPPDFSKAILNLSKFVGTRMFLDRMTRSLGVEDARCVHWYGVGTDLLHFLKGLCESVRYLSRRGLVARSSVNCRRGHSSRCSNHAVALLLWKGYRCRGWGYTSCHLVLCLIGIGFEQYESFDASRIDVSARLLD